MSSGRLIFRIVLVLALLGGLGFFGYRMFWSNDAERLLHSADSTYASGVVALEAKEASTAIKRFDDALVVVEELFETLQEEYDSQKDKDQAFLDRIKTTEGQGLLIRALAIRDRYFAKRLQEGKPIPLTTDSVGGDKFRSFWDLIPKRPKEFEMAIHSLRKAAFQLSDKKAVLETALRAELRFDPLQWRFVSQFARSLLKMEPDNSRAQFMLARYEFEQPGDNNQPAPSEKRALTGVNIAQQYLEKVKSDPNHPLWRTLHLEARIEDWRHNYHLRKDDSTKARIHHKKLRELLLDPKTGALAKAQRGEGMVRVSSWDRDGVVRLHLMALDLVLDESRKTGKGVSEILDVLDRTLSFCETAPKKHQVFADDVVFNTAVAALAKSQPILATNAPGEWQKRLDHGRKLLASGFENKSLWFPNAVVAFAQVLLQEAILHGDKEEFEQRAALQKETLEWLDRAVALGKKRDRNAVELAPLDAASASLKIAGNIDEKKIQPHLKSLASVKSPPFERLVDLLQGTLYERQGRLEKARARLKRVVESDQTHLHLRASMVLSNVYLALGQPELAISYLRLLESAFSKKIDFSPIEQAWAKEFSPSNESIYYKLAVANLQAASDKIRLYRKQNPDKPVPHKFFKLQEQRAKAYVDRLLPYPALHRSGTIRMIAHYSRTEQTKKAKQLLAELKKEFPGSLDVLRLENQFTIASNRKPGQRGMDPAVRTQIDQRIQQFLKEFPSNKSARLYWANWLRESGRADEAVKYLTDESKVAKKDPRYTAVLAMAYKAKGDTEESLKLLQHLPHNPAVDFAILRMTGSLKEKQEQVEKAADRYERNGIFLCYRAELLYSQGKYEEAAKEFYYALDFTRLKPWAQVGVLRSLVRYANTSPKDARKLAQTMLNEHPDDTSLLIALAYGSLKLDDIGTPDDSWKKKSNMASALNRFSEIYTGSKVTAFLTRAEFWKLANDVQQARIETLRALNLDKDNPAALSVAVRLAIADADPNHLARAESQLETLASVQPDSVYPIYLKARVAERKGMAAKAEKLYEQILDKNPTYDRAYNRLINLLSKRGQKDAAAKWIDKWGAQEPNNFRPHWWQIRELAANGSVPEARKKAEQLIARHLKKVEENLEVIFSKKDAEWKKKQLKANRAAVIVQAANVFISAKAWDEAKQWIEKLEPFNLKTQQRLLEANIYLLQEKWGEAQRIYEELFAKNKSNFVIANNLAWILAKHKNRPEEALELVKEFRKGEHSGKTLPGKRLRREFLDTLGVIYRQFGEPAKYKEMIDLFESARQRYPDDPRMYMYLGVAYAGLNKNEPGQNMLDRAIALAKSPEMTSLTAEECTEVLNEAKKLRAKISTKEKPSP